MRAVLLEGLFVNLIGKRNKGRRLCGKLSGFHLCEKSAPSVVGACGAHALGIKKTCIRFCWFEFGNSTSNVVELYATFEELLISFLAPSVLSHYIVVLVDVLQP